MTDYEDDLRRWLEPSPETVARVVAGASAARPRPSRAPIAASTVALVLLAMALGWGTRRTEPRFTLTTAPGGAVLVHAAGAAAGLYYQAQPDSPGQFILRQGGSS
jgi:hypothetical protein